MAKFADKIEERMDYCGLTAVEDRIQKGVPECIESLLHAGIRLWMLTGDKTETAINVAVSSNLMSSSGERFVLDEEVHNIQEELNKIYETVTIRHQASKRVNQKYVFSLVVHGRVLDRILCAANQDDANQIESKISNSNFKKGQRRDSLMGAGGAAMAASFHPGSNPKAARSDDNVDDDDKIILHIFLAIAVSAQTVIACRLSPSQKGNLIQLVEP